MTKRWVPPFCPLSLRAYELLCFARYDSPVRVRGATRATALALIDAGLLERDPCSAFTVRRTEAGEAEARLLTAKVVKNVARRARELRASGDERGAREVERALWRRLVLEESVFGGIRSPATARAALLTTP
jgi:hypothetical protein